VNSKYIKMHDATIRTVHHVGFVYKIIQRCTVNKT